MNRRKILILHGYSGRASHFKELSAFLKNEGFNVIDIWLSEYITMNDEITINDLGQAMGKALRDKNIPEKRHSFDAIVHSTGGLVIRQYLNHYFMGRPSDCPIRNLVMLAPANFGSPLAKLGKSMIGRLFNGWDWDHFMETGTRVLETLEMGSSITWDMAKLDLFNPNNKVFTPEHLRVTVLVGTDAYSGAKSIAHKNGSDGTVYVSTANLNASYTRLIVDEKKGFISMPQRRYYDPIAFGVLYNYNHGSIIRPKRDTQLADLIVRSLRLKSSLQYQEHVKELKKISKATFHKGQNEEKDAKKRNRYHEYQHLVTRVHDQFGEDIKDYFIEFFQEQDSKNQVMQTIHKEALENVTTYSCNSSYRSFMFDITDIEEMILGQDKRLHMSLCAAAISKRIRYHDPEQYITVVSNKDRTLLNPNTTLFVDITLPRIQDEKVFQFIKAQEVLKR